jgi:hypothetical protein
MLNLLTNKLLIMNNDTTQEINILFMARRTRILGIAILVGLLFVFILGVFVAKDNINKDMEMLNYFSFLFCVVLCAMSVLLKKMMTLKITIQNAPNRYFSSYVLPFAVCDLGGLICLMANLFINQNLILAAAGFIVAVIAVIFNFPKDDEYKKHGY